MGKYLLTGSNGFIGKKIVSYIKENYCVDDFLLLSSKKNSEFETVVYSEYTNLPSLKMYEIDTVFHLGSYIPKSPSEANDIEKCNSNISFTTSLLKILPNSVKNIIYISTIDVYGNLSEVINEESVVAPKTLYGHSKLYCENIVKIWANEHSKILQILRLGHIYGRGEEEYKKMIPTFIKNILLNKDINIINGGSDKRSYLHVSDCVRAIYASSALSSSAGIVNIVSGKAWTVKDIATELSCFSEKEISFNYISDPLVERNDFLFNNSKMKKLLCEESFSMKVGLKDEFEYFKEQLL